MQLNTMASSNGTGNFPTVGRSFNNGLGLRTMEEILRTGINIKY